MHLRVGRHLPTRGHTRLRGRASLPMALRSRSFVTRGGSLRSGSLLAWTAISILPSRDLALSAATVQGSGNVVALCFRGNPGKSNLIGVIEAPASMRLALPRRSRERWRVVHSFRGVR